MSQSTLRSHTTGEFHCTRTETIVPSQLKKTIVRELSILFLYFQLNCVGDTFGKKIVAECAFQNKFWDITHNVLWKDCRFVQNASKVTVWQKIRAWTRWGLHDMCYKVENTYRWQQISRRHSDKACRHSDNGSSKNRYPTGKKMFMNNWLNAFCSPASFETE